MILNLDCTLKSSARRFQMIDSQPCLELFDSESLMISSSVGVFYSNLMILMCGQLGNHYGFVDKEQACYLERFWKSISHNYDCSPCEQFTLSLWKIAVFIGFGVCVCECVCVCPFPLLFWRIKIVTVFTVFLIHWDT